MSKLYLIPLLSIVPGVLVAAVTLRKTTLLSSDVAKLYSIEKEYGGCKFLLHDDSHAKSLGIEAAAKSRWLRRNTERIDKFRHLIEQLRYPETFEDNETIKRECSSRPNKLVKLSWKDDKWIYDPVKKRQLTSHQNS